jgi:hypothetical protein
MRKPATGEPCAGEPHARFGGRGGSSFPTPIDWGCSIQSNDPQAASRSRAAALIMAAPFSAIMIVGALVLVDAS